MWRCLTVLSLAFTQVPPLVGEVGLLTLRPCSDLARSTILCLKHMAALYERLFLIRQGSITRVSQSRLPELYFHSKLAWSASEQICGRGWIPQCSTCDGMYLHSPCGYAARKQPQAVRNSVHVKIAGTTYNCQCRYTASTLATSSDEDR